MLNLNLQRNKYLLSDKCGGVKAVSPSELQWRKKAENENMQLVSSRENEEIMKVMIALSHTLSDSLRKSLMLLMPEQNCCHWRLFSLLRVAWAAIKKQDTSGQAKASGSARRSIFESLQGKREADDISARQDEVITRFRARMRTVVSKSWEGDPF